MSDIHNNRAKVTLGGDEFELVASKLAERIYGDRFRNDVETLGESGVIRQERDADGNPIGEPYVVNYSGRLKLDIAISAASNIAGGEIPKQVVAAAWALAKAAKSEDAAEAVEAGAKLAAVMYNLLEATRVIALFLAPLAPNTSAEVWRRLGLGAPTDVVDIEAASAWGQLPVGNHVEVGDPLFPRLDVEAIDFEVE